ncbi:superinfection immunity protein [Helicobacter sp. 23-1044]
MRVLLSYVLIIISLGYLLPSAVAWRRNHNNQNAILVLNLLLGWTFLFWVMALVWGLTDNISKT